MFPVESEARLRSSDAKADLKMSEDLYRQGKFFQSARYAFAAAERDFSVRGRAYVRVTQSLMKAGLYHSASYFFIRTLQTKNKTAIRQVLVLTQELMLHVGGDLIRKYLVRYTKMSDYNEENKNALLYSLGKDALFEGREKRSLDFFNGITKKDSLWLYSLQLKGTANAILGRDKQAIDSFELCVKQTQENKISLNEQVEGQAVATSWAERTIKELDDLKNRCQAGLSRVYYQASEFKKADIAYDQVDKTSFVWADILFEQAWNAFSQGEYNRSLGKLVSYKSPGLSFVHNSEVDVLRAQSYLALCLYSDANLVINEFNKKYKRLGVNVKKYVEKRSRNLKNFYYQGRKALEEPLHTSNKFNKMLNSFVRSTYFRGLVESESELEKERSFIERFAKSSRDVRYKRKKGFPGFLNLVLSWRLKTVRFLGGAFVKNSLIDYHSVLISDFEKMSFIKLEMLSRAKDKLLDRKTNLKNRMRGNKEPERRDDQYRWTFNGEFWNDEIGDYVFGLTSECES